MTNADRIRAMSNEELFTFVDRGWGCPCCIHEPECGVFREDRFSCQEGIWAWLMQPVEKE